MPSGYTLVWPLRYVPAHATGRIARGIYIVLFCKWELYDGPQGCTPLCVWRVFDKPSNWTSSLSFSFYLEPCSNAPTSTRPLCCRATEISLSKSPPRHRFCVHALRLTVIVIDKPPCNIQEWRIHDEFFFTGPGWISLPSLNREDWLSCFVLFFFFKKLSATHTLYFNVGEFDISDAFFPPDKGRETKSFSFQFKSKN